VNQALEDTAKLRAEYNSTKNQIELNIHQQYQQLRKVQTAKELADADLDYAREALSVVMSQMKEGRASLRQLEEARVVENEKWLAFYDAQFAAERARLALLKETGALIAALR
jgi:outer membrane protein TolC